MAARKILIATDFSECSVNAIRWCGENLIQNTDHVILVSAIQESPVVVDTDLVDAGAATNAAECEQEYNLAHHQIQKWAEVLKNDICRGKEITVETDVDFGAPGPRIVSMCVRHNPNMVVVGTHGRGSVAELFLGSVSRYVLNHANKPVIIVGQK
ncbi:hypothetical protein HK102_013340 [Quaeritorhiza haematococci]|nr:hypothetical protein HK102_013340 [Quaeritorhiza haematococci]